MKPNSNGTKPRVHALYELTRRELLPLLLLGRRLRSEGFDFEIEQLRLASNRLFARPDDPAVRLVPFYYRDSNVRNSLGYARWMGEAAIDLCWEQMRNSWNRTARRPKGIMLKAGMVYVAWGPKYEAELLIAGVPPERIHRVGNMRMDLSFHPELLLDRQFLAERYQLDADRPWLLVPWNLHMATGHRSAALRENCRKSDLPFPEQIVHIAQKTREPFFELMRRLPDVLPGWEIILRAHPSGYDVKELRRWIGDKFAHVHTVNELDITNWLVQSRVVVGWSSTALMEAIAAGVPTLCFEPVPYSEPLDYDVGRIAPRAGTLDEALERIAAAEQLPGEVNRPLFAQWYGEIDGKAHVRLARLCRQVIDAIDQYRIPTDIARPKISRLRNVARRALQKWPGGAPLLRWLAHGRHTLQETWLPPSAVDRVIEGGSIDQLTPWLK